MLQPWSFARLGRKGSTIQTTPRLTPEDRAALREYWQFFEPRQGAITAGIHRVTATLADWKLVFDDMTTEQRAAEDEMRCALQREAIVRDDWAPYLFDLHARGSRCARAGVRYGAWFDLMRAYRDVVREHMTRFLREDVEGNLHRATTIGHGMHRLLDVMIEAVGEAYIASREQLVTLSEDRYRALFEHSPLPMWTYDRETLRFVTVNEAAVRHYGFSRGEFAAMTVADIRPEEDVKALHDTIQRSSGRVAPTTWRHRKKDGTIIAVEIQANDFVVEGRGVRLVLVTDVTARDRAQQALRTSEDQLRQAQKLDALGRLAGGVAHDFNNVLYVIGSYATFLEESLEPSDPRHEDAVEIRRAAEQAAGITRQLLTLSRHSIVTPSSISLDEVTAAFVPMLRRLVGERVKLVIQRAAAVPPLVVADKGHIEQVLMNLAVNARDAMPTGGSLTVETSVIDINEEGAVARGFGPGKFAVLSVTDTGTGMSAETQQRMFDAFFTTKDAAHGTGLGLAIVHGIVTQAGGYISVYSEMDRGTTFRIHLPASEETVAAPKRTTGVTPKLLPPITVLVVDDHSEVRSVAMRVLRDAGCTTLGAATAADARQICVSHENSIDVVLLDVVLPDVRGDALVDQLRELRPSIQVVMMSGYPAGALSAHGGAPEHLLAKPFTPTALRAAIARVVVTDTASKSAQLTANDVKQRTRVLLIDDDETLCRTLARVLRKSDFEVVEAESGRKAVAELEKTPFDVIVSDVQMAEMSGLEVLRAVRRVDLDVPVILMSGAPTVEAASVAVELGAFRYLTKPFEVDMFAKTVRHAARAHSLARLRREAFTVGGTHAGAADRAGLEVRYEQAVEGLFMAFQPIVEARSGVAFGIEALMRSSEVSLPTPQAVLDAATTLGRLPQLGRRIRTLSAAAIASRDDDLALFVNLHPDDIFDVELIDEAAPLTRIANRVVLEITERSALSNSPALTVRLARLRTLGYRLAVDDIGSGYSGLTSFTELNPAIVKLDMSIVRDVHVSTLKQRTIRALCGLCHEGGCLVVGEGVETVDERECLIELGCDFLQGYLIGRPSRELTW